MAYPAAPYQPGEASIVQDPTTAANQEKVNADGSINSRLQDPASAAQAGVNPAHLTKNQAVAGNALNVAGFGALTNILGNSDPQAEASFDNQPHAGNPSDVPYYASVIPGITISGAVTGSPTAQNVTLSPGISGTLTRGAPWKIQVGSFLSVGGANPEFVYVISTSGSQVNGIFAKNHSNTDPIVAITFNVAKDATVANPTGAGTGYSATQLFNNVSSSWEDELSASGENSGASGSGTAVAAEYEETSGGPPLANGTPSLLRYDREVAALGKAAVNAGAGYAITSTTAGDTILTPTTAANFKTLTAGQWIRLSGSGTNEYVRVANTYTVATAPSTIPLTSPVVNTGQTTATWDAFGANGPGTNPILLTGEGLEGVILNDSTQAGFGRMWQGDPTGNARVSIQAQGTPVTSSQTAAVNTAFATTTLPAVASKTNYTTGFSVTTQGGTGAAAGVVTVTGTISGTLNFQVGAAANNPVQLVHTFPSPIPASAVNTAITVNVPTLGANTGAAAATIYGFVQ